MSCLPKPVGCSLTPWLVWRRHRLVVLRRCFLQWLWAEHSKAQQALLWVSPVFTDLTKPQLASAEIRNAIAALTEISVRCHPGEVGVHHSAAVEGGAEVADDAMDPLATSLARRVLGRQLLSHMHVGQDVVLENDVRLSIDSAVVDGFRAKKGGPNHVRFCDWWYGI